VTVTAERERETVILSSLLLVLVLDVTENKMECHCGIRDVYRYLWEKMCAVEMAEESEEGREEELSACDLLSDLCSYDDLEDGVMRAFQSSLTPLLFDPSAEEIVCTFYSYQTDVILLESKAMIMTLQNESLERAMEMARRSLVNAMKYGKTLVIRMGTSAPDFRETFNDENLRRVHGQIDENLSYFPKELFIGGGRVIRENGDYWAYKLFREADMYPHRNVAYCR
jgi:hypothetical protein